MGRTAFDVRLTHAQVIIRNVPVMIQKYFEEDKKYE